MCAASKYLLVILAICRVGGNNKYVGSSSHRRALHWNTCQGIKSSKCRGSAPTPSNADIIAVAINMCSLRIHEACDKHALDMRGTSARYAFSMH